MNTDTCPDCSNHPCDCGIPAGCTPRTDELANRLIPIAENITATTAQTIITQVLIDVLTLTTKLETELAAVTEQRDKYRDIASELIAMIRINVIRDTFKIATIEQVDEHLKQWIERIAAVKGGADE